MPIFDSSISTSAGFWNQKMAESAKVALSSDPLYQDMIVEQKDNTLIITSPSSSSIPDITFVNTLNSSLNMTIDAPSGVVNQIDYGKNPWGGFLGSVITTGGRVITKSSEYFTSIDSLDQVNLATIDSSNNSLSIIDASLELVNSYRSNIGAYQNRLESIINGLYESIQNTTSSKSRIIDTDYASETTLLARNQIIHQAATAMLAQANQYGRNVLSLLK